jgi:hypothetical protein
MMMQELVKYAQKVQYPEEDPARWQNEDLIAYAPAILGPFRALLSNSLVCRLWMSYRALPPELQAQLADAMCWRTLYGRRDVEEAISKVHRVSFHQHIVRLFTARLLEERPAGEWTQLTLCPGYRMRVNLHRICWA